MAEGHRKRLKDTFLEFGLESFEPHKVIELLLFYSCPRIDTNPLAHELINRFGSVSGVFDADYNELLEVKGVQSHTATLLKLIPELSGCYMADKVKNSCPLTSRDAIGRFLIGKFTSHKKETVYALLFDSKRSLIAAKIIQTGSATSANVNTRGIVELALEKRASSIVLAHNHPHGAAVPSPDDIRMTDSLKKALSLIDVELIDHYIVADNTFCTILNKEK